MKLLFLLLPPLCLCSQSTFKGVNSKEIIPGNNPVETCGDAASFLLNITMLNVLPNPPLAGKQLAIEAVGQLKKTIEEGSYIDLDVKYGYIKILHQQIDLCEQIKEVDLECPLKKGPLHLVKTVELPKEIPPGKYIATAKVFTSDDVEITCLTAAVSFSIPKFW